MRTGVLATHVIRHPDHQAVTSALCLLLLVQNKH